MVQARPDSLALPAPSPSSLRRQASTSSSTSRSPQRPSRRSSSDDIELDTSPPSRSASPLPRREVSFDPHHQLQDYGAMSTPRRSLDGDDDDDDRRDSDDRSLLAELEHALVEPAAPRSERWERAFALLVACLLSVGSHYGSYLLGPLKNRLRNEQGVSNTQFSLLLAALSLNNTWTPLVGGLLTAKIGTPRASILATSVIFLGQLLVLLSTGNGSDDGAAGGRGSIAGMAAGLFIFGLGVSPLAVVQETIIVRYFSNHGLGVSLAFGLVAGKASSWLSSVTSYPLSVAYGTRGPFVVSTSLAGLSFAVNVLYLVFHARLHPAAEGGAARRSDDAAAERVIQRRKVKLLNLSKLGDVFWLYILMNVFSGAIWSPFLHLSANIVQRRFQLPDAQAASYASLLLAGAIFLYPLAGFLHDLAHRRSSASGGPAPPSTIVYRLLTIASCLTLACFAWLVAPAEWTQTPLPGLLAYCIGHGMSTLLLVLVVPGIVAPEWVSTALGTHKSMESAATTFTQTLSGLLLDKVAKPKGGGAGGGGSEAEAAASLAAGLTQDGAGPIPPSTVGTWLLMAVFLALNVCQLLAIVGLWRAFVRRSSRPPGQDGTSYAALPKADDGPAGGGGGGADDDEAGGALALQTADEDDEARRNAAYEHHAARTLSSSSRRPLLWSETASVLSSSGSVDLSGAAVAATAAAEHDCSEAEVRRGRWFFGASVAFILLVWATFAAVSLTKG